MRENLIMQIWRYILILFAVLAGLGGCQTTPQVPPATTADEFVPIAMNARRLEIIDNWQMRVEPPYIGHRAQTLPSDLWLNGHHRSCNQLAAENLFLIFRVPQ